MIDPLGGEPFGAAHQIAVDRHGETPIREGQTGPFAFRFAYGRSADTRDTNGSGQDFLIMRHDDQRFAFALCDGVSESFQGEIAAVGVGSTLVEWLWSLPIASVPDERLRSDLADCLQHLKEKVSRKVRDFPLPPHLPPLLREVLDLRRGEGTETMLVAARVDHPSSGLEAGRVVLIWLGDSRLRFWGPAVERTGELGDTFHTRQRWSSHLGPVHGSPQLRVLPLTEGRHHAICRLAAYSDGLALLDRLSPLPPTPALQQLIDQTAESPASDDVSFVEVCLAGAAGGAS